MSATASKKAHVLIVSLEDFPPFVEMYKPLLDELNTMATVERATESESVIKGLAGQLPHAVLVSDAGISQHPAVYLKLLAYIHNGGTLVFMGNFSSMIRPDEFAELVQAAGLFWRFGDYHRTTVYLNNSKQTSPHTSLPPSYSAKAVFLSGVSSKDKWYLQRDYHQGQSPVALTNIGKGKIGFVGDVNGEEGSDAVVLAMCNLGDGA